jgi:hypothetical protein
MKIYLKFDHSKKDSLEAIGCENNGEQVNDKISDLVVRYIKDDDMTKQSHLAEMLHKNLEYEEILFLAVHSIQDKVQSVQMAIMKDELRNILGL